MPMIGFSYYLIPTKEKLNLYEKNKIGSKTVSVNNNSIFSGK